MKYDATINRNLVIVDDTVQIRPEGLDTDTVSRYREALANGEELPPIDIFVNEVGQEYILAEGFHRVAAMDEYNQTLTYTVDVVIHQGGLTEARIFAATANSSHGLPLTRAGNKAAAKRLLAETAWSYREISRRLSISDKTVARIDQQHGIRSEDAPVQVTRNGVTYTMDASPIGRAPTVEEPSVTKQHSKRGKCRRCNRPLTDPDSVAAGIGECCANAEQRELAAQDARKQIVADLGRAVAPEVTKNFVPAYDDEPLSGVDGLVWLVNGDEESPASNMEYAASLIAAGASVTIQHRRGYFVVTIEDNEDWSVECDASETMEGALGNLNAHARLMVEGAKVYA